MNLHKSQNERTETMSKTNLEEINRNIYDIKNKDEYLFHMDGLKLY